MVTLWGEGGQGGGPRGLWMLSCSAELGLVPCGNSPSCTPWALPSSEGKKGTSQPKQRNPPPPAYQKTAKTPFPCTQPAETHLQETLNSRVTHTAQNQVGNRTLRRQAPSLNRPICRSHRSPRTPNMSKPGPSSQVRYNVKSPSRSCVSSSNQPRGCSVLLF